MKKEINKPHAKLLVDKYHDYMLMIVRVIPSKDNITATNAMKELNLGKIKSIWFLGDSKKLEDYANKREIGEWYPFEGDRRDVF